MDIEKKLNNFKNPIKTRITKEENEILKKMFQIEGGFNALYKYFLLDDRFSIDFSLKMDFEEIDGVKNLEYLQTMIKHLRHKLNKIKQEIILELEGEKKEKEEEEEKEKTKEEKIKQEISGVGVNV